jgi:hypothetical protein
LKVSKEEKLEYNLRADDINTVEELRRKSEAEEEERNEKERLRVKRENEKKYGRIFSLFESEPFAEKCKNGVLNPRQVELAEAFEASMADPEPVLESEIQIPSADTCVVSRAVVNAIEANPPPSPSSSLPVFAVECASGSSFSHHCQTFYFVACNFLQKPYAFAATPVVTY